MSTAVFTEDEVDLRAPVKPAPVDRDYLKTLVKVWESVPLLAVVKSRRMWITWLFIALYLHDALIHTHRRIFFVSKKEEDADALVKRAYFIYKHIPRTLWADDFLPVARYKENHLLFDEIDSSINAVASGPDQLRQYTASGVLMDEFAFWEKDRDTYTASKPTIQGGGRVTIVSTPPPQYGTDDSFFKRLCFDTIES